MRDSRISGAILEEVRVARKQVQQDCLPGACHRLAFSAIPGRRPPAGRAHERLLPPGGRVVRAGHRVPPGCDRRVLRAPRRPRRRNHSHGEQRALAVLHLHVHRRVLVRSRQRRPGACHATLPQSFFVAFLRKSLILTLVPWCCALQSGTISATLFVALAILALLPVRAVFWELFKLSHITLWPTAFALSVLHARMSALPALTHCLSRRSHNAPPPVFPYVIIPAGLWALDWAIRWVMSAFPQPVRGCSCCVMYFFSCVSHRPPSQFWTTAPW